MKRAAVPVAWHGGPVLSLETEHLPSVVQENVHLEVTGGLWSRPAVLCQPSLIKFLRLHLLSVMGIRGHGGSW